MAMASAPRDAQKKQFETLYHDSKAVVFRYALRHCLGDREGALDVMNETFLQAWQATLKGTSVTEAWLMTTARRRIIDRFRRTEVRIRSAASVVDIGPTATTESVVEDRISVFDALERLDETHRFLVIERYIYDRSVADIARSLDRNQPAVDSMLRRAVRSFRRNYPGYSVEEDVPR